MFEEEKQKLEKRKSLIDQVEIPLDKLQMSVKSGFEKAKQEKIRKRKITQRSLWSVSLVALLFIAFVTSVNVSPAFANKVSEIPGMERVVALIQNDKGLVAAVENDFYQSINASKTQNGITVTLDGVIADKKGMVIFYTVKSEEKHLPMEIKRLELLTQDYKYLPAYSTTFWGGASNIIKETEFSSKMTVEYMPGHWVYKNELLFTLGLKSEGKVDNFKIPFTFERSKVESKKIVLNKDVSIEGQKMKVKEILINPIRAELIIEVDPSNSMEIYSLDNLKLRNDLGDEWVIDNGGTLFRSIDGAEWNITLQSPYYNQTDNLYLTFGKIAALDKDEAYILIDTESGEFLKQPKNSIFSDLNINNENIRFHIGEGQYTIFSSFVDSKGKEFLIKDQYTNIRPGNKYVNGSWTKNSRGLDLEFQLPEEPITNPIRLDILYYPNGIEDDVKVEILPKNGSIQ